MIVVDASVLVGALMLDGPAGDSARDVVAASDALHAPELAYLEVTAACRRGVRHRRLQPDLASRALDRLLALPLIIASHAPLTRRIWELRDRVSAYDGAYVALAEALGVPLATADARLARAADGICQVQLVVADG